MPDMSHSHDTHTLTRDLTASADTVFAAFSDAKARATWSCPSPDLNMSMSHADFRPGGQDTSICGPGPAEGFAVETHYHAITAPSTILSTEILRMGNDIATISLVTIQITPLASGSQISVTLQSTSPGGPDDIAEVQQGWQAALENLAQYLTSG